MTPRASKALGAAAMALLAAGTVLGVRHSQPRETHALDAVPAGAFLVLTIDVARLRASPFASLALDGPLRRLFADATVTELCGFDPLEHVQEVAVAIPVEEDSGEFGVALRADVGQRELLECARKVADKRGHGQPLAVHEAGSFTVVDPDEKNPRRHPALAYREGGPFLVASGAWLTAMMRAAEGQQPSARTDPRHTSLRRVLGEASDDQGPDAVVATVLLPKEMRERIKREMGAEVAGAAGDANSAARMAGVLGVEAAGVAVDLGDRKGGGEASVACELECEDDASCASVGRLVARTRDDWAAKPAVVLLGARALFDGLTVEAHGKSVRVTAHAPAELTARWIARALDVPVGHAATPARDASSE